MATAHVHDLAPDAATITLYDDQLRQGCMTHHVPAWARPCCSPPRICGASPVLPCLTDFAESCKLRPPRPKRRKGSRAPAKRPTTIWPVSYAHYALSWAVGEGDLIYGCLHPPPHPWLVTVGQHPCLSWSLPWFSSVLGAQANWCCVQDVCSGGVFGDAVSPLMWSLAVTFAVSSHCRGALLGYGSMLEGVGCLRSGRFGPFQFRSGACFDAWGRSL